MEKTLKQLQEEVKKERTAKKERQEKEKLEAELQELKQDNDNSFMSQVKRGFKRMGQDLGKHFQALQESKR